PAPRRYSRMVRLILLFSDPGWGEDEMSIGTDRPLPEDLADEIRDCIPVAERILGIDRDELSAEEVHRKIFDWMYARWKTAKPLSEEEYDEFIVPLACLWGEMICEQLGWNWAWVEVKRNEGPAIIRPYAN